MANPNFDQIAVANNPGKKQPLATAMAYQGTATVTGSMQSQLKRLRRGVTFQRRGVIVAPIPRFKSVTHDTTVQASQTGGVVNQTGGTNPAPPAFTVTVTGTRYRWPISNLPTTRT